MTVPADVAGYLFLAGAAVSGLVTARVAVPLAWWGIGAAAFAVAIGRSPLVAILGLFVVQTVLVGIDATRRRGGHRSFAVLALSDLALAAALTAQFAATGMWRLPGAGSFAGGASSALAVAAALRLIAVQDDEPVGRRPLLSLCWWQGAYLAWLAGPAAAPALVTGAAVALGSGVWLATRERGEAGYSFAGALTALAAALGAGPAALAAPGLAAAAYTEGERAVAAWTLGVLPLSAVSLVPVDERVPTWALAPLAIVPVAWAVLAARLGVRRGEQLSGRGFGLAALAAAAGLTAAPLELLGWFVYAFLLAAGVAAMLAPEGAAGPPEVFFTPESIAGGVRPEPLPALTPPAPVAVAPAPPATPPQPAHVLPWQPAQAPSLDATSEWMGGAVWPKPAWLAGEPSSHAPAPSNEQPPQALRTRRLAPAELVAGWPLPYAVAGWATFAVTAIVGGRLALMGLVTGFL